MVDGAVPHGAGFGRAGVGDRRATGCMAAATSANDTGDTGGGLGKRRREQEGAAATGDSAIVVLVVTAAAAGRLKARLGSNTIRVRFNP